MRSSEASQVLWRRDIFGGSESILAQSHVTQSDKQAKALRAKLSAKLLPDWPYVGVSQLAVDIAGTL